jgi:hypothetical protein
MKLLFSSLLILIAAGAVFGQANPPDPKPLTDAAGKPLAFADSMQFQYPAAGAVPRSLRSKLADNMNIADFGAKCDGASDDSAAIQAAIRAAAALSGTSLGFPLTGHACGIKRSIDLPSGVIFRGQGPSNNSGLAALPGGVWSTYIDDRDRTPRTYMISIGGGNTEARCKSPAVPYADYRDMIISGNRQIQVTMLNQCGEEQSGFHNILTGGGTFAQIVVQTSGAENSNYENLNIFPGRGTYGILTDANSRVMFSHVTINGGDFDGIEIYGSVANISNVHCEHVDSCVHIVTGGGAFLSNIDSGPFVKTASVVIGPGTFGAIITVMTGQNPGGDTVPFVKDSLMRGGATLGNYGGIGYYFSYMSNYGHIGQLITSDPQVPWILPSNMNIPAIRSNSGLRFVCVDTAGKLISQAAPCAGT